MIGRVFKSTGKLYKVKLESGELVEAFIAGKLRTSGHRNSNPIAVGDKVEMEKKPDGIYLIHEIDPRQNYIIRRSTKLSSKYHIIASNIDQAVLVITIKDPHTPAGFIDRFLVTSSAYSIPALLVFNKQDVLGNNEKSHPSELMRLYREIGYNCIETSTVTGEGIEEFRNLMRGKTSLISGISGVGKSSLINKLDANLHLRTAEISSAHDRGKHTTTFAEMFQLDQETYLIDTPGLKSFALVEMDKNELHHYFPEFFRYSEHCKYANCIHLDEPECCVKEKVMEGLIAESRYASYCDIIYGNELKIEFDS